MKKIELHMIEIDEQAYQDTKRVCAGVLAGRRKIFVIHESRCILALLWIECKRFLAVTIGFFMLTMLLMANITLEPLSFLLLLSACYGLLAFYELMKNYEYQIQEISFPTRIGGTRFFICKGALIMSMEMLCLFLFIAAGMILYHASLPELLLVTWIPCFLLHGIAMQILSQCFSLKRTLALLLVFYAMYYGGYWWMLYNPVFQQQIISRIGWWMLIALLLYLSGAVSFHQTVNIKGGFEEWN